MSVDIMSAIWKSSPQKGNKLLMLLAIADNASDEGWAFPAQATLAKKVRVNRRNAQKIIDALEADGEIVIYNRISEGNGEQHYSNVYHLPKYCAARYDPPDDLKGILKRRITSVSKDARVASLATLPSVAVDIRVVSPETHESSQEPSTKPSQEPSAAATKAPHKQDSKTLRVDPLQPWKDKIASYFEHQRKGRKPTKTEWALYQSVASELRSAGYSVDDLDIIHRYCTVNFTRFSAKALASSAALAMADSSVKVLKPFVAPPTDEAPDRYAPLFPEPLKVSADDDMVSPDEVDALLQTLAKPRRRVEVAS